MNGKPPSTNSAKIKPTGLIAINYANIFLIENHLHCKQQIHTKEHGITIFDIVGKFDMYYIGMYKSKQTYGMDYNYMHCKR